MPAVQWAYWTLYKTLNMEMILKVWNRVETVIGEENTKRNLHVLDPLVVTVHGDQEEEITHLCEVKHIRITEAIWRGNLRLRELKKYRVQLRKKSILMDAEIKRLENEITQACLVDKPRMTRQDTGDCTTALEECR